MGAQESQVSSSDLAVSAGALLQELHAIHELLASSGRSRVAFGGAGMQQTLENWPITGQNRTIVVARALGGGLIAVPNNVYTDLLPPDPARVGMSVLNYGSNPVFVFLAKAGDTQSTNGAGTDVLWLNSGGGSWDGKISSELWCGAVCVFCPVGTTNLAIAAI